MRTVSLSSQASWMIKLATAIICVFLAGCFSFQVSPVREAPFPFRVSKRPSMDLHRGAGAPRAILGDVPGQG